MNLVSVESVYEVGRVGEVCNREQADELEFLMITYHHFGVLKTTLTEILATIIQILKVFALTNRKLLNSNAEMV